MKKITFLSLLMFLMMAIPMMTSCSKDDGGGTNGKNGGGNTNPNPPVADIHVVVKDDGTTSNGSIFSAIDDKNFYVDYIKYTVEDGHLFVSGYDKDGFKGVANIVARITYKGNTYEVLKVGHESRYYEYCGFWSCTNLTSVNIPSSVTSIGYCAFRDCSNLTSLTIGNSVTSIVKSAFSGCSGLTSIKVESGNQIYDSRDNCNAIIETATNTLIKGCSKTKIPSSVTSIGDDAFSGCDLTSVTIPSSVTSIGDDAFHGCYLTSVTIPSSVTSIGDDAFDNCSYLTSVNITDLAAWCGITFGSYEANPLYKAHHLYLNGEEVKDLIIPNSVTSIGSLAFSGCSGLTSVTIPSSVTSIGDYAFAKCSGLTSVTIPSSVTSIGNNAFRYCNGLTAFTIGNSVTSIGEYAFYGCSGLTSIVVKATTPPFLKYDSFGGISLSAIYVPQESVEKYKNASRWNSYSSIIKAIEE